MEARLKVFGFLPGSPYWDDGIEFYAAPDWETADKLAQADGLKGGVWELKGAFAEGEARKLELD